MRTVVVVGATGHIGRQVVARLRDAKVAVRAVTHRPDAAPIVEGVKTVDADLRDSRNAGKVVEKADAVYLTLPEQGPQPLERERGVARNVIRAAADAGVRHLVMGSALHASKQNVGVGLLDNKARIEQELAAYDVPYTILRPGILLDVFLDRHDHIERGQLASPFGPSHPFGAIGVHDVARAVEGLIETGPQDRAFDLHLPGGTTMQEVQHVMSDMLERQLDFHDMTDDVDGFVAGLDMEPQEKRVYAEFLAYVATSDYVGEPSEIRDVLDGFRYSSLERTLHDGVLQRRQSFETEARPPEQ